LHYLINDIFDNSVRREQNLLGEEQNSYYKKRSGGGKKSSILTPPQITMTTTAESELKIYWCHECDMSVSLISSLLLCPHCHTNSLEPMDSPFPQNNVEMLLHSSRFNDFFEEALSLFSPPPPKTHTETITPTIIVTPSLLSGVVLCAVCTEEISVDEEAKQLPCNHLYHSGCIIPWLHRRSSCPMCRFQINDNDVDDKEDEDVDVVAVMRRMVPRLSELSEDDGFYGLRITINNVASRRHDLHASVTGENSATDSEPDDGGVIGEY